MTMLTKARSWTMSKSDLTLTLYFCKVPFVIVVTAPRLYSMQKMLSLQLRKYTMSGRYGFE